MTINAASYFIGNIGNYFFQFIFVTAILLIIHLFIRSKLYSRKEKITWMTISFLMFFVADFFVGSRSGSYYFVFAAISVFFIVISLIIRIFLNMFQARSGLTTEGNKVSQIKIKKSLFSIFFLFSIMFFYPKGNSSSDSYLLKNGDMLSNYKSSLCLGLVLDKFCLGFSFGETTTSTLFSLDFTPTPSKTPGWFDSDLDSKLLLPPENQDPSGPPTPSAIRE